MVFRDPVFDFAVKPRGLDKDLLRFGLRGDVGEGVVDGISLSPTGLEVVGVGVSYLPKTSLVLSNDTR